MRLRAFLMILLMLAFPFVHADTLNYHFVGNNHSFTGFQEHNGTAGYITEESWSGDDIFTPDMNLNATDSYTHEVLLELNKTHTTKLWFNSEAASHSGNYYTIEDTGSNLKWKYIGDTYPEVSGIPYHGNLTITVLVNASSNKTSSTVDWDGGSGSTSEQSFANNEGDHASFDGGSITGELKIWNWEVNRSGIASGEPAISISLVTPDQDTNVKQNKLFNFTTQVCCTDASCGQINVSLDPISEEYTHYSKKTCEGGTCTTSRYSTPRYGYENQEWKPLEELESFDGTVPISCEVESDGIHHVECIDYNYTHQKLRITLNDTRMNNVPIKHYTPLIAEDGRIEMQADAERTIIHDFSTNRKQTITVPIEYGEEVHVGAESTIISYVPDNATSLEGWWESTGGTLALYGWNDCDANSYSSSEKSHISTNTTTNSIYGSGGGSNTEFSYCHRMIWEINETVEDITDIWSYAHWTGSPHAGSDSITKALYIGNEQSTSWESLDTQTSAWSAVEHSGSISNNIGDYVNESAGSKYVQTLLHYNATKSGGSSGAYSNFYYTELRITTNESNGSSGGGAPAIKNGLVSNTTGDKPFYTIHDNPQIINLNKDQCTNVTWMVNATGKDASTHEFFTYANQTADTTINAESKHIDISIRAPILPASNRINLSYDANGNLLSGDGKYREYNSLNQLWKVYNGSDNTTLLQEYEYHPIEERIIYKKTYNSTGSVVEEVFYFDKSHVRVKNATGSFDYTYIYHDGQLIAQELDGVKHFILTDHLGSSTVVTNSSGSVVENTTYTPYGLVIEGGDTIRYGYEAKEHDSVVGDTDFHFRKYKAEWGLFTQPDNIIPDVYDPQSLNRYSFELNNPVKYTDEDGHIAWLAVAGVVVIAIVIVAEFGPIFVGTGRGIDDQTFISQHPDYDTSITALELDETDEYLHEEEEIIKLPTHDETWVPDEASPDFSSSISIRLPSSNPTPSPTVWGANINHANSQTGANQYYGSLRPGDSYTNSGGTKVEVDRTYSSFGKTITVSKPHRSSYEDIVRQYIPNY